MCHYRCFDRYYKCATAKKHKGCKKKTVRKQWLEDLVVNQTMQLVKDDAAMESIIAKVMELQNKENTNIPLYEKQLWDAESGIQNMLNAIQAGILTSSTKERLEQLEETKRELEARIAEEKLAKPKVTEEFIRFWLLRFRKLDMRLKDQRQSLKDLAEKYTSIRRKDYLEWRIRLEHEMTKAEEK